MVCYYLIPLSHSHEWCLRSSSSGVVEYLAQTRRSGDQHWLRVLLVRPALLVTLLPGVIGLLSVRIMLLTLGRGPTHGHCQTESHRVKFLSSFPLLFTGFIAYGWLFWPFGFTGKLPHPPSGQLAFLEERQSTDRTIKTPPSSICSLL